MTAAPPAVGRELRIDGTAFCQVNCFQEALVPLLRREPGLREHRFERLRMIDWSGAAEAAARGVPPGIHGGLDRAAMTEAFAIAWRQTPSRRASIAVRELLRDGHVLVDVDRSRLPADERWHGGPSREHTLLVTAAVDAGAAYLDSDHPILPATVTWEDLDAAALPGAGGLPRLAAGVGACAAPGPDELEPWRIAFASALDAALATPVAVVGDVLAAWGHEVEVAARDRAIALSLGLDPVGYLNGIAGSMSTAGELAAEHGDEAFAERLCATGRAGTIAARRLAMVATAPGRERTARARLALDEVRQAWRGVRATSRRAAAGAPG